MRCVISKTPANGLTRMEVLSLIAILALLATLLLPGPLRRSREKARHIQCVRNLQHVAQTTDRDLSNLCWRVAMSWRANGTFHLAFP